MSEPLIDSYAVLITTTNLEPASKSERHYARCPRISPKS